MNNFVNKVFNTGWSFVLTALILIILSFTFRFLSLNQTAFGNGWDTYFYMVQIQSWHDTGSMHSPEWTLFYPLLLLVDLFTSDYVTAVKITSALLASAFTGITFHIANQIQPSKYVTALVASYTVFSPELTYFSAQWPKNLLGVIILILLLNALWNQSWRWVIALLIFGFFGHRMTAVLGVGIVAFMAIRKHISYKVWIGVLVLGVLFILTIQFVPGIVNMKDIARLNNLVVLTPQFPVTTFIRLFGSEKVSLLWQAELWIAFIIALLVVTHFFFFEDKRKEVTISLTLLLIVLWMPFYYWEIGNAAYRFFHVGILLAPLFMMIVFPASGGIAKYLLPLVLVGSIFSWKAYNPSKHDPNYALYEIITNRVKTQIVNDKPELIIAHKSLAEFYSFKTKTDAMPWIPDYEIAPEKLWRIAVFPYPKLMEFYTQEKPIHLTGSYYFVRESTWQKFVSEIKKNENESLVNEHLTWLNPNDVRPAFLKKNRH